MPLATSRTGDLHPIKDCYIKIGGYEIIPKILPEITDSKSATYNDEPIIGRSSPIKTYSHSDTRTISMRLQFIATEQADFKKHLQDIRRLQSAVYPRNQGDPYKPPQICTIKFKKLLGEEPLCVVLKNYSNTYPIDVAYDPETGVPFYFSVTLSWDVVYASSELPGATRIITTGR